MDDHHCLSEQMSEPLILDDDCPVAEEAKEGKEHEMLHRPSQSVEFRTGRAKPFMRVTFGSCIYQELSDLSAVHKMTSFEPNVIVLLGDNVYLDQQFYSCCCRHTLCCKRMCHLTTSYSHPTDSEDIESAYDMLLSKVDFSEEATDDCGRPPAVLATWDDHDFGYNNAKANNPIKDLTRAAFLDFFKGQNAKRTDILPLVDSLSRETDRGIFYFSDQTTLLQSGDLVRVRFIMLDARWYRGAHGDKDAGILGKKQKRWLLKEPLAEGTLESVDWFVIGSGSVFLLGSGIGEEGYDDDTRKWLLDLLKKAGIAKRTVFISGDLHFSMVLQGEGGYTPEFVASSFTHSVDCCTHNCCVPAFLNDEGPNLLQEIMCGYCGCGYCGHCCCHQQLSRLEDQLYTFGFPVDSRLQPRSWCCGCCVPFFGLCGENAMRTTNENGFGYMKIRKDELRYEYRNADGVPILAHCVLRADD